MRGSTIYQVQQLWQTSGINQVGTSKHAAKIESRAALAAAGSSATAHNVAKTLGIHSYNTADAYRDTWVAVLNYAKNEHGIRDIEKITGEHVAGYLKSAVSSGIKYATFQQYAAAAEKLSTALNCHALKHNTANRYDFSPAIHEVRKTAQCLLERFSGSRVFSDPLAVRNAISNQDFRVAAALQHTGGARLSEVALIRPQQLRGVKIDSISGVERGYYEARGKGGKVTLHHADAETYRSLEKHITENGLFRIDKNEYRAAIKEACTASGNSYSGSHSFRWSFCSERFNQCMTSGMTYEQSLAQVSSEMSHNRTEITEHYRC